MKLTMTLMRWHLISRARYGDFTESDVAGYLPGILIYSILTITPTVENVPEQRQGQDRNENKDRDKNRIPSGAKSEWSNNL